eukprot:CAMPEP_0116889436 /NCGR_PEP_ID=MMETSP0463-20121206/24916_1 /TAXON_ID=181622 /ORGANISM="Strombidinopsis sp, Strain SopsisLIS2011" /LENGTH=34 /DNA_ID= /DNA_START= /DNA_END= /DNA_ORIENTATION=
MTEIVQEFDLDSLVSIKNYDLSTPSLEFDFGERK